MTIGSVIGGFDRHPRVERAVGVLEDDLHFAAHACGARAPLSGARSMPL